MKYRCRECGAVFHLFTQTVLHGIRYNCTTIVLMLRGFAQGKSTKHLAEEVGCDYGTLLGWRHRLQDLLVAEEPSEPLPDEKLEADEVYQNAGEKGDDQPDEQARGRANSQRGRGTMASDRPPIVGVVGRESGHLRLIVAPDATQETILPFLDTAAQDEAFFATDGNLAYAPLAEMGYDHETVAPQDRQFAKPCDHCHDETTIHNTTIEGIWTSLRNFLRRFRGVHKRYLHQYVALFEWTFNRLSVSPQDLHAWLAL